jgi:hypothetical protein
VAPGADSELSDHNGATTRAVLRKNTLPPSFSLSQRTAGTQMVDNTGRSVAHRYGTGAQSKEEPPRCGCADGGSTRGRRPPVGCRSFSPSGSMSQRHLFLLGDLPVGLPPSGNHPMRRPLSMPAPPGTLHTVRLQTVGAPRGIRRHPVRLLEAATSPSVRVERTRAQRGSR